MTAGSDAPLVWVDCEMTGLDSQKDNIIEICCLITDGNLDLIEPEGFEAVIHYPQERMDDMNEWCVQHHGDSGLTAKVVNSTNTLEDVEARLLEYIKKYVPKPRTGLLAGNSIHQDRIFMVREFPKVIEYLNYRQIDVSSFKEIAKRVNPRLLMGLPEKKYDHTARADIEESIKELKWYYENFFVLPEKGTTKGVGASTADQDKQPSNENAKRPRTE
ncbi:hypothetical protein DV495_000982 [Geotrichum candidum]|uniref:Similar to Saccharomyces cerevisiae YLR059C REX2 3'-5' RNA exonuclease n=1 Tax=Geotrichum candidum TaxID=1173061 RepID=A0A0J9XH47_GEOCN|nr:hypothetical protein DV454_003352 [Geotrichum candidum]KAI9210941.1 hypothetical protein DS838_004180 [Geotrichum bryndzae]KAF5124545.1 hypothetical protein DV452_000112 [Geotrichum candidum]KAF5135237.1 hypothetical protein DV495_000982 [Geotrichum candidum]KAF7499049.1 hypothetical protein DV113_002922 [Geotrichum candidum]